MATKGEEFNIEVTFGKGSQSFSQEMADAVIQAASFWENAITQSSFDGEHTLNIEVGGTARDDRALASATFTDSATDANGNIMPTEGIANVNINRDTLASFNSDIDSFTSTMIHEFGHVMGIGTLWETNNLIDPRTASYDANTNAGRVYGELIGRDTPTAIPLTSGEGEGSDLSHWDEETFSNELMTHQAEGSGVSMPMSMLTLASLEDMGWNVDDNIAQSYPDDFTVTA